MVADEGEEPDRPNVVTESRRRWSRAATADTDSRAAAPLVFPEAETELLRWNRLENAVEVIEPRRS